MTKECVYQTGLTLLLFYFGGELPKSGHGIVEEPLVGFAEIAGIVIITIGYDAVLHASASAHFKVSAKLALRIQFSFAAGKFAFDLAGRKLFYRRFHDTSKPPLVGDKEIAGKSIAVMLDDDVVAASRHESTD